METNISRSGIQSYLKGEESRYKAEESARRNAREEAITSKEKRLVAHRAKTGAEGYRGSQAQRSYAAEFPQEFGQSADAQSKMWGQNKERIAPKYRAMRALQGEEQDKQFYGLLQATEAMGLHDPATSEALAARYGEDKEAVFAALDAEFGMGKGARKETERDRKIQGLRSRGFSREESVDITDGRMRPITDPLSGETSLLNIATQEVTPVGGRAAPEAPGPAPEAPAPAKTVFDQLGEGVGIGAVFAEGLSRTAGQFIPSMAKEETTRARTGIRGLREKLLRALSMSGRQLVVEQTRLLENIPSTGIFESEPHARAQLTELHGQLSRQLMDDYAFGHDTSNPKELRKKALEQARHIEDMLRELGDPVSAGGETPTITTQEEFDALPSGTSYTNPDDGKKYRKQ